MNRSISLAFVLAACGLGCGGPQSASPPPPAPPPVASKPPVELGPQAPAVLATDADVEKAGKAMLDLIVELTPESATALGLTQGDDRLDDRSLEGQQKIIEREEAMVKDLEARFVGAKLSRSAAIDLRILKSTLAVDARWRRELKPWARKGDFYTEPMNALFLMNARDYAPIAERAKNALTRIEKLPKVLEQAKATLGSVPTPAVWTQVGAESAGGAKEFFESMRPFLEKGLPKEKPRVTAALKAAKEAYADYKQFLEKELKPKSQEGGFAAGRDFFDWLVHEQYFLKENADELQAIGLRIFGVTDKQLAEVAKRIDPNAPDWKSVVKKVKSKHPTAAELLPSYRKEMTRARKFLAEKDVVEFPAGDDCQVIETPPFQRSTVSAAYDQPPPFAQNTKGFFFVTPVEPKMTAAQREQMLRENDFGDIVDTTVHETYPGHHLQLSFARTNPSLIRKATGPSIFSEGWALYSEELMSELGYYKDEERIMQLEWTLVRAARVMIDVGLHTKGMTFDQAVAMLTDQVGLEKELALSEVKRYTGSPTQPLAYLIGREKIFGLREKAKARDGKSFSLKKFHTDLLTRGTVAPGLLEEEIFGQ